MDGRRDKEHSRAGLSRERCWGQAEHVLRAQMWKEGRLGLCGPPSCDTAPGPCSQEVMLHAPTVMPCSPFFPSPPSASAFIIAMLLASLNSCCNPWIYMLFTGHLFQELVQRFLCCSSRRLKGSRPGETSVSKKSNSTTFVLSQHSCSQRRCSQPSPV